ncbi:MAG: peptide chain release factor 2 [Neisseriaceae bacterium]|nr:MAG: peptide chain release factor 2 [Neisseriaceae bacterium]
MESEKINELNQHINDIKYRTENIRGYLDYEEKKQKLEEICLLLEDPDTWNDISQVQRINKEKKSLENIVDAIDSINSQIGDAVLLLEIAIEENDYSAFNEIIQDVNNAENKLADLEFKRMFNQEADGNNCFIDIVAGAGGTEAEDWAGMLLRMYIRYAEHKGFRVEVLEENTGDIAGINRASLKLEGDYAYGLLRTETGIHRLVRCSPFDSSNKRHTSFASVFVYPEVDDSIDISINPSDLKIDTYRASGAGGQHINKTDSAVRITHIPSGIIVQCQNDRSQHRNKEEAMQMLKSKLYELEMRKHNENKQALEDSKSEIGWGNQIRSYVFDQSRIKDLRTGYEVGNIKAVMNGHLDDFIQASLKQGV